MHIKVPQELLSGLDDVLHLLAESRKIQYYKFIIGNPPDAYLNDFDDSQWTSAKGPEKFERHQGTTWFRFDVKIPEKILDIPLSDAEVRLSSFFTAPIDTYVDGVLKFSEKTWMDFKNPEIILTKSAIPGQTFKIAAKMELGEYCYFNGSFSMNFAVNKVEEMEFEISSFKQELSYACRFKEVKDILPKVFELMAGAIENKGCVTGLVENIRLSRKMLEPMKAKAKEKTVHLIGHAHIDMNWFWSIEETHDLVRRDFGTMTQIMEEIPDFKFSQSQCATYEMAEKLYPDIFERIKKFIKAGNWDITASTWVEGDMNMSSGEAIVRQILLSKKYHMEKFGIEPRIMWCPDTFGHSANVPQIAKKAGIDYYYFMRCGSNKDKSGYDIQYFAKNSAEQPIFWWEGIDGSRVLAYNMVYGSDMNAESILGITSKLEDKHGLDNSMYVYGTGDHGGGPTRRDIMIAKQLDSFPTTPNIKFSTTHSFYDSVINERKPVIPVEKGELNFVFDGCYTTHADIKKYNRQCENLLTSVEALAAAGSIFGQPYEKEEMEECWKAALFNQFHDIFDGSGVKATYKYSREIAEKALQSMEEMSVKHLKAIGSKVKTSVKGVPVILFNTTGWKRSDYVLLQLPEALKDHTGAMDNDGNRLPTQAVPEGLYVYTGNIPSMGYKVIYLDRSEYKTVYETIKDNNDFYEINTKFYRMELKKDSGQIVTLYDRLNSRYLASRGQIGWKIREGMLNTFQVNYEVPEPMSSWSIAPSGSIKRLVSGAAATVKADGPLLKIINFRHQIGSSLISQDIVIYADSPRIDFKTTVDWKETGDYGKEAPMLKACFTPDIENKSATYDIPFGTIERPCKDMEVPALKWIDISDGVKGMSLMNDCKYGHKVLGNSMEITLIRSGWEPDPASDTGIHQFTYSMLPHSGTWKDCGTVRESWYLNNPVMTAIIEKGSESYLPESAGFVEINDMNTVISAFKPAEDGNGIVIRFYNTEAASKKIKAEFGFDLDNVHEVDLIENKVYGTAETFERGFAFSLSDYEVKTFRLGMK